MTETHRVAFRGWPSEALEFYEGLAADNSKTYWTEHKAVYESQVHAPMVDLLAELEPEFGTGKIFRPYRDVRFSADKSPYKTHLGAWLDDGGYLQLSADGLAAGCGMYEMAPDQLDRYRRAVADHRTGPHRRARSRQPEDRAEGLPQGASAVGSAPAQGTHHVEGVAAGGLAGHRGREAAHRRVPPRQPAAPAMAGRQRGAVVGSAVTSDTDVRGRRATTAPAASAPSVPRARSPSVSV
jgi:Conserved hypothetical protein (DUF2461)